MVWGSKLTNLIHFSAKYEFFYWLIFLTVDGPPLSWVRLTVPASCRRGKKSDGPKIVPEWVSGISMDRAIFPSIAGIQETDTVQLGPGHLVSPRGQ